MNLDTTTALSRYFGYASFRPGQEELVSAMLEGRDVLGIMPTGAGKSICYQLPALLMEGVSLVISPLISLMQDQVSALVTAGIPAAYFNSALSANQYRVALDRAAEGRYKIIYVAPERLATDAFLRFALSANISMVTIDEAHCVSQWGQDFRPSYLAIAEFIEKLPSRPVVSAFTATATTGVKADILELLDLHDPFTTVTGFDRENLYFEVRRPQNKMRELLAILAERKDKSGIIYCATRKAVESVCEALCDKGYAATRYHAGLEDGERKQNQEDFLYDRRTVMVATNAFGMGIDKSNVGFVIHYNMPKNLESYYQEAGRAGRDGTPADAILLYAGNDVRTAQFMIEHSREADDALSPQQREVILANERELLRRMTFYATGNDCLRGAILKYFGEKPPVSCGHCGNCDTQFETVDVTPIVHSFIQCVGELRGRGRSFGRSMIVDILRGSRNEKLLRFGLSSLSCYGSQQGVPAARLFQVLDMLVDQGTLAVTNDEFPVLTTGPYAESTLGEQFTMQLPKPKQKEKKATANLPEYDVDMDLFSLLRKARAEAAKRVGVPAYVVFTDAALRDMCAKRPTTPDEFLNVSGVGEAKLERYGEEFLKVIASYTPKED